MRFSEYFNLNRTQALLDFVDVPLDTDLAVFLDPGAIRSLDSLWGHELTAYLQSFFSVVLTKIKNKDDDGAKKLLASLNERNEFHLGYSAGKSQGHGFGSGSAHSVWNALTKSKAVQTGLLRDLEDTALLIEGIGTDMISDAVSNILRGPLIKYTQDICVYYNIPLTPNIASGPIWDINKEAWIQSFVPLPMTPSGKIILVPKVLVRYRLSFQYDQFYRHYLLPEMQDEHISSNSSLVKVLKDGSKRVTKKSLMEKYGSDKLSVIEQTIQHPDVYKDYKQHKAKNPSSPLTHGDFEELENNNSRTDVLPYYTELKKIKTGTKNASAYEDIIEKVFSILFYPSLCYPQKQEEQHNGRKRVDLTYLNEAKYGFFKWLSMHYFCPKIYIECKNYSSDVANPELDQLSGRFSLNRGNIGILVCRKIENKALFRQRCKDTATDGRGFILALDDEDIEELCNSYKNDDGHQFQSLLRLWNELIS
ncbi:hypothetical protein R3D73_001590 [Serratia marcescens]|nr:hypothetical protein [Serratia marcescens]ELQ9441312.1 hypothetical protein [Serratia marcescens]ELT5559848.1 hypothetical protein [Serratia marcescens]